ncbi:gamma-glutamyltransferase family protein [Brachybacterium sp. YJGR34]|uniref:gamma-glutamyltransferase family protein n=1 Tax=Brachybacterium sp. YJGR34 TaxID=2059911 RepID=UPI000E0C36C4|nr:gamma-glutamyltransferase [Brachybacterium sp. YJGR34]
MTASAPAGPSFLVPPGPTTRPTLEGTFGMSASTHWIATATMQSVLERGGNAFDAAAAGAFVLHVVEPHLNGPGGDVTAVLATGEDPTPRVLMGQGPAPAGATIEHYRSEGLDRVPGTGALAAAVPFAVDAWLLLLAEHGTWELADVLEHAIDGAENGHPVLERVCAQIATVSETFTEHWPSSATLWMPDGRPPTPGALLRNPEYAAVLRDLVAAGEGIGADGQEGRVARIEVARTRWRTGPVAQAIADFLRTPHRHSDGADHAGVMTLEDLAAASACFEPAATASFRGVTVAKTGPWGQGAALLQALRHLDGLEDDRLDPSTERGAHTILETLKLVLADRDTHFGDGSVALDDLLSEEYLAARRALVTDTASREFRPGLLGDASPVHPPLRTDDDHAASSGGAAATAHGSGEPTVRATGEARGDTCHLDVVDRWGNIISATPSGGWLQSSPAIPGLGFCLGTRLQMMWLDEALPSALRPGARPRTTLTPTLVLRAGEPVLACGSPGGDQQDQWQLLFLLRVLVGGLSLQEAIDAPALHTLSAPSSFWPRTWSPGSAVLEDRIGEDVIAGLEARGHRVTRAGDWSLGRLSAVMRDPDTGVLRAAANSRGAQGYAAGR